MSVSASVWTIVTRLFKSRDRYGDRRVGRERVEENNKKIKIDRCLFISNIILSLSCFYIFRHPPTNFLLFPTHT